MSPPAPGAGYLPKAEPQARPLPERLPKKEEPAGASEAGRGPAAAGTGSQPAGELRDTDTCWHGGVEHALVHI